MCNYSTVFGIVFSGLSDKVTNITLIIRGPWKHWPAIGELDRECPCLFHGHVVGIVVGPKLPVTAFVVFFVPCYVDHIKK